MPLQISSLDKATNIADTVIKDLNYISNLLKYQLLANVDSITDKPPHNGEFSTVMESMIKGPVRLLLAKLDRGIKSVEDINRQLNLLRKDHALPEPSVENALESVNN